MTATIKFEKAADLSKAIESIATRGKKLQEDIHSAAVSCLYHADKHGDVTLMQKLIEAVPAMSRKNALIAWCLEFGKFAASDDGRSVVYSKEGVTDIEAGATTPFWEFKPEAPFKAFDLQEELAKLIKKAEKASNDDRNVVPLETFKALRDVATLKAV